MRRKDSIRNACVPPAQCRPGMAGQEATYDEIVEAYIRDYRDEVDNAYMIVDSEVKTCSRRGRRHTVRYRFGG